MSKLEQHLEVLANKDSLQDVGIGRPYPAEWDTVPYPPKFKAPTLHTFDSKRSTNQHTYYFKSQTNDAIIARFFISTLKGVGFEWFMKLSAGSIMTWADLGSYFWLISLKTIKKFQCQLSLQPSRKKESLSKLSLRDFRAWHSFVLTV